MATKNLEEIISISEFKKNPALYFRELPIAITKHDKTVGYVIGKKLFEDMIDVLEEEQSKKSFVGSFRPTRERLDEIVAKGKKLLLESDEKLWTTFSK